METRKLPRLFDGDDLFHSRRMPTDRTFTADEVHMRLEGYFRMSSLDLSQVKAIAFAGVVPELSREWHAVAARLTATATWSWARRQPRQPVA